MKALVLCGGSGTRLKPFTETTAKQLLPVANRPVLYYILEHITGAGIDDIGIIIAPGTGLDIKETLGSGSRWGARLTYILQPQPLGLAHAVKTAGDFLADSPFLMFLGDNLTMNGLTAYAEEFNLHSPDALVLLKEVADPHLFGIGELGSNGRLVDVVEKPRQPKSNLALVGMYFFSPRIHRAIAQIKPSGRGELEITDAIKKLLELGGDVKSRILDGWWLDIGGKESLLEANHIVLEEFLQSSIKGDVDSNSRTTGSVEIGEGTNVINSLIHGPVSIAENCRIKDSVIQAFSSIAAGTNIENSCLEESIIFEGCSISNIGHMANSIIGRGALVSGQEDKPEVAKLFVGDGAEVIL